MSGRMLRYSATYTRGRVEIWLMFISNRTGCPAGTLKRDGRYLWAPIKRDDSSVHGGKDARPARKTSLKKTRATLFRRYGFQ